MAALPVTVYRWDDPGAPQLSTRKASEWIEILRKCLVTGYGSKAAAGWSVAFEDAASDKITFRSAANVPGYPGGFIQLWSRYADGRNNDLISMQTAPMVSQLDPDWNTTSGASYMFTIGGTSYPTQWMVFATSLAFYIVTSSESYPTMAKGTRDHPCFGAGAIDPCYLNDVNGFGIFGRSGSDSTSSHYQNSIGNIGVGVDTGRFGEVTGDDSRKAHASIHPFGNLFNSGTPANGVGSANPTYGKLAIGIKSYYATQTSTEYQDSQGTPFVDSVLQPPIRGSFPGILVSSSPAYSDQIWPVSKTILGKLHYLIPNPHNGGCAYWINAEEWYE